MQFSPFCCMQETHNKWVHDTSSKEGGKERYEGPCLVQVLRLGFSPHQPKEERERESFRKAKQVVSLLCRWPVPVSRTKILRLLLDDSATTNEKDERQITKIGKPKISTKF